MDYSHYIKLTLKFINCMHASCLLYPVPVSSAGCERAFSKLCLVKDELRSTMGDERLNGLMLMAVEKNIVKDLDLQTLSIRLL